MGALRRGKMQKKKQICTCHTHATYRRAGSKMNFLKTICSKKGAKTFKAKSSLQNKHKAPHGFKNWGGGGVSSLLLSKVLPDARLIEALCAVQELGDGDG